MNRCKELLDRAHKLLVEMITREHGKVFFDAIDEMTRGFEVVEFTCSAPALLRTEFSDNIGGGIDNWNLRRSLGVCTGIMPFNFPVMVLLSMILMALVTGNTFILKLSERGPYASLQCY
ncbi:aldehyde dehydrogenase family protein [Pantoea vagans]|uniref:aldehyde dehydrogenase family protein n=1 Tax=Pantoea vagans TaxID=470934 RepID=UPI00301A25E0